MDIEKFLTICAKPVNSLTREEAQFIVEHRGEVVMHRGVQIDTEYYLTLRNWRIAEDIANGVNV